MCEFRVGTTLWNNLESEARRVFRKEKDYVLESVDKLDLKNNGPIKTVWCKLRNSEGKMVAGTVDLDI